MENFRLNSRVSSPQREYLIQTSNDIHNNRICSALFSDGVLIETSEEEFSPQLAQADLLALVKSTHKEWCEEVEHLFQCFEEALKLNDADLIDSLGMALFYKRMDDEAETLFRRAVEIKPDTHKALNHLGMVLMTIGKSQEAIQYLERCVELQPKFADYRNNLGEAYLAEGLCKRAFEQFDQATAINIYYGDAYYNKALTYMCNAFTREDFDLFSDHQERTRQVLEKATVICPEFRSEHFTQGVKLLERGELESAYESLLSARTEKKAGRQKNFFSVYMKYLIGANKLDEKLLTRRIRFLKDEISKNPHFCDLHYDLAVAYTLLGRFIHSKAITEYKQALKINPDFKRAEKSIRLAENELRGLDTLVKVIAKG